MKGIGWHIGVTALFTFIRSATADLDIFSNPGASLVESDYRFIGETTTNYAGRAVAFADYDGDGRDDVVISSVRDASSRPSAGKIYFFAGANLVGGSGDLDLSTADFSIVGTNTSSGSMSLGTRLAGGGDVDNDGYEDILTETHYSTPSGDVGRAYLFLGDKLRSMSGEVNVTNATHTFSSHEENSEAGRRVAFAGDVDNDGRDDVLISSPEADNLRGKVYLFLGSSLAATSGVLSMGKADFTFRGKAGDEGFFGQGLAGLGDMNFDGRDEILIGAPFYYGGTGIVYLYHGSNVMASSKTILVTRASAIWKATQEDDLTGWSLAGPGDVTGDGVPDMLVGAPDNDDGGSSAGKTYLIAGRTNNYMFVNHSLSSVYGKFVGESSGDDSGYRISGAGDVNGDGRADFIIGAKGNDDTASQAGKAYVVLGPTTTGTVDLSTAEYALLGEAATNYAGYSLEGGGDVNSDGRGDLLVGAYYNNDGGSRAGKAYLVMSDYDCEPTNAIYVDGFTGASGAAGGEDCPVRTIAEGLSTASGLGITNVIVRGWLYYETVQLLEGIQVRGELRGPLPPFIINTNTSGYTVSGANRAALKYCTVVANYYTGGIDLDADNEVTLEENVVSLAEFGSSAIWNNNAALRLYNGSSYNRIINNMFYSPAENPTQAVVVVGQSSDDNLFLNNTIHRLFQYYQFYLGRTGAVVSLGQYIGDNEFRNNIVHCTLLEVTNDVEFSQWAGFSSSAAPYASNIFEYNKTGTNNPNVTMGTGCIVSAVSPAFTLPAPDGFNYTLNATSICVNAGDPGSAYNDPDGTRNDMGVFGGPTSIDFAP